MAAKEDLLYKIWLSEQIERFEGNLMFLLFSADMVSYLEAFLSKGGKLPPGQRHQLSGAFCKLAAPKRFALEKINLALNATSEDNQSEYTSLLHYKKVLEDEIRQISNRCIKLIDDCMKDDDEAELKALYHCVKADSFRYLCECETGDNIGDIVKSALEEYKTASRIAIGNLNPTNAIRLGIAINLCIFYLYVANNAKDAYGIAHSALRDADAEIANLQEKELDGLVQGCLIQLKDYKYSIQKLFLSTESAEGVN
ncbi:unnamed protein product [Rodentolepis nana]|uniref:14_3_3 domain-containing protein n=1 Tax=Rodentolepis nana TaxID=102285 RepID=A0A0R3T2G5_RODNA|nr:unnamed protein product [Rodentolepis nana]